MKKIIKLRDLAATQLLGADFASSLPEDISGWLIVLRGELGAGKSTFAREIILKLGHSGSIPSPTYTLIEPYRIKNKIIYHIDLYRVSSFEELHYLGWSDLEDGLKIVEWPEKVEDLIQQVDVDISFAYEGSSRVVEISPLTSRGHKFISRLSIK